MPEAHPYRRIIPPVPEWLYETQAGWVVTDDSVEWWLLDSEEMLVAAFRDDSSGK